MTVSSLEDRALLYQKMDQMIMEDYPIVPLYYDQAIRFVQKEISGFEMNPLNLLQLKRVRKN
jgi:peptide/nickel transport system substrate-binding protein